MALIFAQTISAVVQILTLLIIAHVILSYFMSPFHPVRETIDRIIAPLLNPIRSMLPQTGMLDFSPLVALILIQLVGDLLIRMILSL